MDVIELSDFGDKDESEDDKEGEGEIKNNEEEE